MENIIYNPSGNISIRINQDKMSAWMYIHKSGNIIDEKEILSLIDEVGIVNGFEEALQWMAANGYNKDFEKPFPVAICKPTSGNERLDLFFNKDQAFNPDREWEIREIVDWTFVDKGTALAAASFNVFNETGSVYNIYGELTNAAPDSSFLTSYLGKNVSLDMENQRILADETGYPYLDSENKINVETDLVFKGDIKLTKFPFPLATNLIVEGSVNRSNVTILKDLTVTGNLINSGVIVEGNLVVESDIVDSHGSGIIVKGDLTAKSISNSSIMCKGQVQFETAIKGSKVIADKSITGNPDISQVYASHIMTSGFVDIADAGNVEGNETEIEITINPYTKAQISQLEKTLSKIEDNPNVNAYHLNQVSKKLAMLEKTLSEAIKAYSEDENQQAHYIKVRNELFKGVYARVLKKSFEIKLNQSNVELTEE